jgi:hypothetical protein
MDPIDGPVRRLNRARVQLDYLQTEAAKFLSGKPYSSTTHFNIKRNCYVFIAHVRADPDPDWGFIAAESIHNMRATLDNILWTLAPAKVRRSRPSFPIHDDPVRFLCEAYPTLQGLPAKLFEAIEWCQPYNRNNLSEPQRLLTLNALWNADKHHAPLAVGSAAEAFAVWGFGEEPLYAQLTDHFKGLYEGKEIGWASGLPTGLEDKLNPPILFSVAFSAIDGERVYPLHIFEKAHSIIADEVIPRIRAALL